MAKILYCAHCGQSFETTPWTALDHDALVDNVYCSSDCAWSAVAEYEEGEAVSDG